MAEMNSDKTSHSEDAFFHGVQAAAQRLCEDIADAFEGDEDALEPSTIVELRKLRKVIAAGAKSGDLELTLSVEAKVDGLSSTVSCPIKVSLA